MKKLLALLLCITMLLATGCSSNDDKQKTTSSNEDNQVNETSDATDNKDSKDTVKITFLNTKGEIQASLEEVAKTFKSETGIELEIVPCAAGQSPFQKMSSMYAAGNAPTLSLMDAGDLPKFKEKLLDLSSEKWINDAMDGSLDIATMDDKLYAFPFAVEGFGLIYNKSAIEKATNETFNKDSIKTREDLRSLFEKIQAGGTAPMIISPLDWSLGAHYTSIAYAAEGKNLKGILSLIDSLKKGEYDLNNSKTFNSLIDSFDLLAEYNIDKDDVLSGTYEKGAEAVATGKTAFWFMGNWAWPQIKKLSNGEGEFGFLPIPLDVNNESNKIVVGPTKYVAVDSAQNSEAQQKAALTFLNWLVYENSGQEALVAKCNIIPAFNNITKTSDDALAISIKEYMSKSEFLPFVGSFPSDYWKEVGAHMQKYLSGYSKRDELFKDMLKYWKNAK